MAAFDAAIPPGSAGKVTASVHTDNLRGPIEKAITVVSSDAEHPMMQLRLKANVVGSVEILPFWQILFPTAPEWGYTQRVVIRKDKSETGELAVTGLTTTSPWLTAKASRVTEATPAPTVPAVAIKGRPSSPIPPPVPQPGDWVIDVGFTEEAPSGQSGQQIRFKTGLGREPEVAIPVSVVIQQPMHFWPENLSLPLDTAEETSGTNTFHVALRPGLAGKVPEARATPEGYSVTLKPDGERLYEGTVVWTARDGKTEKNGQVIVTVGGESGVLPLRVVVRAPGTGPKPGTVEPPASGASSNP